MDENENRNEFAAAIFSVLAGLAVLLLAGWLTLGNRGCTSVSNPPGESANSGVVSNLSANAGTESHDDSGAAPADPEAAASQSENGDDSEVETLQAKVDLHAAETQLDNTKAERDRLLGERDAYQMKLEASEKQLRSVQDELMSLEDGIGEVEARLEESEKSKKSLQARLDKTTEENRKLSTQVKENGEARDKLKAAQLEKENISKQLAAALAAASSDQSASDEQKMNVRAETPDLKQQLDNLQRKVSAQAENLSKAKAAENAASERILTLEKKIDELGRQRIELSNTISNLKAEAQQAAKKMAESSQKSALHTDKISEENESLKTQIAKLEAASKQISLDARERIAALAEENKTLQASLSRMKGQSAEVNKLQEDKKALNARIAELTAATAAMKANADKIKSLSEQKKKLETEITRLKAASSRMDNTAAEQIKKLMADNRGLTEQIAKLTEQIRKHGQVEESLKKLQAENKKMKADLADSKKKAMTAAAATKTANQLKSENEKLKAELKAAREKLDQMDKKPEKKAPKDDRLKPAVVVPDLNMPHLVKDPNDLDGDLRPLFAELRGIEDDPESRIQTYEKIRQRGKSSPAMKVKFDSGSSTVVQADQKALAKLPAENKRSKFLVVGYASVDGDAKSNARLASERASNVAVRIVDGKEAIADKVQAVYFGQTNRFSRAYRSPNRIVEVWTIGK